MRQMFVLMHDCSKNFVQYLTSRNEDFMELELYDSFTRYSNDIIASTAFGIDCNSLKNKDNEFFVNGKSALDFSGIVKSLKFMLLLLPKVTKVNLFKCCEFHIPNYINFQNSNIFLITVEHIYIEFLDSEGDIFRCRHIGILQKRC